MIEIEEVELSNVITIIITIIYSDFPDSLVSLSYCVNVPHRVPAFTFAMTVLEKMRVLQFRVKRFHAVIYITLQRARTSDTFPSIY